MRPKYPFYWGCQSCGASPINGWYETAEEALAHKPTECSNVYHGATDGILPDGRGGWRDVPVSECFHIAKHGEGYI